MADSSTSKLSGNCVFAPLGTIVPKRARSIQVQRGYKGGIVGKGFGRTTNSLDQHGVNTIGLTDFLFLHKLCPRTPIAYKINAGWQRGNIEGAASSFY